MRKTIVTPPSSKTSARDWLDLERLAQVEVNSEHADHPIESALHASPGGWRANEHGVQTIRVLFDAPQHLHLIRLVFDKTAMSRTQELALPWHAPGEKASHDIVRQQYTFSPSGSRREIEEYTVDLPNVAVLELQIVPDISGGDARASLSEWLIT